MYNPVTKWRENTETESFFEESWMNVGKILKIRIYLKRVTLYTQIG